MSACRSVVLQKRCLDARVSKSSLAPLVDLIEGYSKRKIKKIMEDVMPVVIAPDLRKVRKETLIDQLLDFVRSSGLLADVCHSAMEELSNESITMILRLYDAAFDNPDPTRSKSEMIQHFTQVNIDYDDDIGGMIPKICGAPVPDCDAQVVNYTHIPRGSKRHCFRGHDFERHQMVASGVIPRSWLVDDCGAPMADCDAELVDYQTAVRLSRKREDRDMCQKRLKRARKLLPSIVTDRL